MNPPIAHAELIARYRRAAAEAAHKADLVKAAASKGPRAIVAASETATKAARRRDVLAAQLVALGVALPS